MSETASHRTDFGTLRDDLAPDGRQSVFVDGVRFDAAVESDVHRWVLDALQHGRGGLILTPNVDIMRHLHAGRYESIAHAASIVVADGRPIVWASTLANSPLPERVTGSSLIRSLSVAAAREGHRIMLLGGHQGVAERAAAQLLIENPGLDEFHWHYPPFGFDADDNAFQRVIEAVRSVAPDIIFIGLGFPRQEQVALRLLTEFPSTWLVGCGGSIAMVAGDVSRAPKMLQALGLEWAHRLAQEPRRLARRYLIEDLPYAVGLLGRALRARVRRQPTGRL